MSPFDFAQVFMTKQHLVICWKQMTRMNTFHLQCQYQGLFQPFHAALSTSQALPHEGPPSKISPIFRSEWMPEVYDSYTWPQHRQHVTQPMANSNEICSILVWLSKETNNYTCLACKSKKETSQRLKWRHSSYVMFCCIRQYIIIVPMVTNNWHDFESYSL